MIRNTWMACVLSMIVVGCIGGVDPAEEVGSASLGGPVEAAPVVAANGSFSCILADGGVRCWGSNRVGQLGLGNTIPADCEVDPETGRALRCSMPVDVPGLESGVKGIALGHEHACALIEDGTVRCWGNHTYGSVGVGNGWVNCDQEGSNIVCINPMRLTTLPKAKAVAAGFLHTCALLADGTARCWGSDSTGQLGNGDQMPAGCSADTGGLISCNLPVAVTNLAGAKQLSLGRQHSCAVLANGALQCWGNHFYGALGIGSNGVPAGCVAWGGARADYCKVPVTVPNLPAIASVAAGGEHTCAITAGSRDVRCWGMNFDDSAFPVFTTAGALGVGATVPAGCTDFVGSDGVADVCYSPVQLAGVRGMTGLWAGEHNTCGRMPSGQAMCWGSDAWGVSGLGDPLPAGCQGDLPGGAYCLAPVAVPGLPSVSSLSAGSGHGCAITPNYTACWGINSDGALGLGGSNPPGCEYAPSGAQFCTSPVIVLGL